jgi:hypothetical protein
MRHEMLHRMGLGASHLEIAKTLGLDYSKEGSKEAIEKSAYDAVNNWLLNGCKKK